MGELVVSKEWEYPSMSRDSSSLWQTLVSDGTHSVFDPHIKHLLTSTTFTIIYKIRNHWVIQWFQKQEGDELGQTERQTPPVHLHLQMSARKPRTLPCSLPGPQCQHTKPTAWTLSKKLKKYLNEFCLYVNRNNYSTGRHDECVPHWKKKGIWNL